MISVVLECPQVPVSCEASGDFTCVFTLGGIDPEAGITTFLEVEADRPSILAGH